MMILLGAIVFWLVMWALNAWLARQGNSRAIRIIVPILFGVTVVALWEWIVWGWEVNPVLLPAPSAISAAFVSNVPTLWADFLQTFVQGALTGYIIGCGAAFVTAIAIDRSPFLQRGLLPVGNFVAALPIVGIAPVMVMWFGFGWQSKAAVVVIMVFFPMLVNTVQGMKATDPMQRDLMRTYAASYPQRLMKLRLPAAAPFIFNGLKISTTLALIGAIVAEYFGSPIVGMGFRIQTELGRLNLDMVWAEIVVAAIAGTAFYGLVTLLERAATFWHPSQRG